MVVTNSLSAFATSIDVLADRFRNNIAVMAAKTAIVALESAAIRTPVDTSLARSNWVLDTQKPTVLRSPYSAGRKLGINERIAYGAVVGEAQRSARSIARDYILSGRPIYVSNPTPYIGDLNAGSSPQNTDGAFDLIAAELARSFAESYARSGRLLTIVDSV